MYTTWQCTVFILEGTKNHQKDLKSLEILVCRLGLRGQREEAGIPVLVGVAESLSDSTFTVTSPVAGVRGEAVSSFTSSSVLDWDWRIALPFAARTY